MNHTTISFRANAIMDMTEDLSQRDLETLLQDDNNHEEPQSQFAEFNPSDLLNSPLLFNDSGNSSNSFGMQMDDIEPTPLGPFSGTSGLQYHLPQTQQLQQSQQFHHHQQQQQSVVEAIEAVYNFSQLKPTNQLFEPTPMRTKLEPHQDTDKRMMIDSQGFPVYREKHKPTPKNTKQRQKHVPNAPAGPIPIAPMPPSGIPPDHQTQTRSAPLILSTDRELVQSHHPMPHPPKDAFSASHSGIHPSIAQFILYTQQQQQQQQQHQLIHSSPMISPHFSFPPPFDQEHSDQSMQHIPSEDFKTYSEGMEKLCESMRRSAMSRKFVKNLSAPTGPTAARNHNATSNRPLHKKQTQGRLIRQGSIKSAQSNESNDSGSCMTPPIRSLPTRKPSTNSKYRSRNSRHRAVALPLDFHTGEDSYSKDAKTAYSADNLSEYSTDNSTAYSNYSGHTV